MKAVIRQIDRALKRLYHLDSAHRAEDFLLSRPIETLAAGSSDLHGALYVRAGIASELSLGIFLSEKVTRELSSFAFWRSKHWSHSQIAAFTVAAEEVSHFHYLLHHAAHERSVSQLELELQGEIDKFLLTFFANRPREEDAEPLFEALFEQLFYFFHFAPALSSEQRDRYRTANHLARRFIRRHARMLTLEFRSEWIFRRLRKFYRLNASDKMSAIGPT